ncbi:hypothetical protein STCU_10291 [Strigomonas culicis]|uniref:Uncharacterized protein n=1 Tax=Strigomonas culicis TaxID=28005 RepID=S9V4Y6_9TRYP|nr:hypothetical protein STCU_10291 [Strigomonas culicis]|eukprot:EPY17955.1 hypothetical protein STCU_10291 [Strigomonas culicis]
MARARLRHKTLTRAQIHTLFQCIDAAEKELEAQEAAATEEQHAPHANNESNNKIGIRLHVTPAEIEMICGFCHTFEDFMPFFRSLIHNELHL